MASKAGSQPSPLCEVCQAIFDHFKKWPQDGRTLLPFHETIEEIQLNADTGCPFCAQVLSVVQGRGIRNLKIESIQLKKHDLFQPLQSKSVFPDSAMLRFEFLVPEDEQHHVPVHVAVLPEGE